MVFFLTFAGVALTTDRKYYMSIVITKAEILFVEVKVSVGRLILVAFRGWLVIRERYLTPLV